MPDLKPDDFARIATLFVPEMVSTLAVSPCGKYLVIAAGDKLHVHAMPADQNGPPHNQNDFPKLTTLFMPDVVQSVVFSADSKLMSVAIADKVHIYTVPAR